MLLLVHKLAVAAAANVNLHGARPWHLNSVPTLFVATNVSLDGAKAVASVCVFTTWLQPVVKETNFETGLGGRFCLTKAFRQA